MINLILNQKQKKNLKIFNLFMKKKLIIQENFQICKKLGNQLQFKN